jgi:hypothetical protein
MTAIGEILASLIFLIVIAGTNIGIAVLLYRDSKRRNNNAALWAVVTLLFGFSTGVGGLIIALIYMFGRIPSSGKL